MIKAKIWTWADLTAETHLLCVQSLIHPQNDKLSVTQLLLMFDPLFIFNEHQRVRQMPSNVRRQKASTKDRCWGEQLFEHANNNPLFPLQLNGTEHGPEMIPPAAANELDLQQCSSKHKFEDDSIYLKINPHNHFEQNVTHFYWVNKYHITSISTFETLKSLTS